MEYIFTVIYSGSNQEGHIIISADSIEEAEDMIDECPIEGIVNVEEWKSIY